MNAIKGLNEIKRKKVLKGGTTILDSISAEKRSEFISKSKDFCKFLNDLLKESPTTVCNMENLEDKEKCIGSLVNGKSNLAWTHETNCSKFILDIMKILKENNHIDYLNSNSSFVKLTSFILKELEEFTLLGEISRIRNKTVEQEKLGGKHHKRKKIFKRKMISKNKKGGSPSSINEQEKRHYEIDKQLFEIAFVDDNMPKSIDQLTKAFEKVATNEYGPEHPLIMLWYDVIRRYDVFSIMGQHYQQHFREKDKSINDSDKDLEKMNSVIDVYIAFYDYIIKWKYAYGKLSEKSAHDETERSCNNKIRNILQKIKELNPRQTDERWQTDDEVIMQSVTSKILTSFITNYGLTKVIYRYSQTLLEEYKFNERKKELIKEYITGYEALHKKWTNFQCLYNYIPRLKKELESTTDDIKKDKLVLKIQKNEVQFEKKKDIFIKGYEFFYNNVDKFISSTNFYYLPSSSKINFWLSEIIVRDYRIFAKKTDHNPYNMNKFTKTDHVDATFLNSFYERDLNKEVFQ